MQLITMQYKDFVFPINPESIEIKHCRNISETELFGSDSSVQNVSRNACTVSAAGAFFGSESIAQLAKLEALYKETSAGYLFLPQGECIYAFFSAFSYTLTAGEGAFSYKLAFTENCRHVKPQYAFGFTYAGDGENAFDIAARTGTAVERIVALNGLKGAFDICAGDKVVLK